MNGHMAFLEAISVLTYFFALVDLWNVPKQLVMEMFIAQNVHLM